VRNGTRNHKGTARATEIYLHCELHICICSPFITALTSSGAKVLLPFLPYLIYMLTFKNTSGPPAIFMNTN